MPDQITPIISQLRNRIGTEGFGESKRIEIDGVDGKSFSDMVADAIDSVDEAQKTADQSVQDIVTGKSDNIHEAMISMEKAQLSFQLMMEVRNKAVETYKELSRMQI